MTVGQLGRLAFDAALATAQLGIAAYIYFRGRQRVLHRAFGAMGVFLAAWTILIGLAHTPQFSTLSIVRLGFAAASLLLLSLVTFVAVFPSAPFPWSKRYGAFLLVGCTFAVTAAASRLVVEGRIASGPDLFLKYGRLYTAYATYILCGLFATFIILFRKLRHASRRQRLQLRYLLFALSLPAAGIAITNLLIPLIFKISRWGRYGPAFTLLFLGITAHAIIREGLMDIRVVIGQTVSYAAAIAISGAIFVGAIAIMVWQFPTIVELPLLVQMALAFGIALLFGPVTARLRTIFDRYCYRMEYDYNEAMRRSSRTLSSTLDLQQLLRHLFGIVADSIRPEFAAVYLHNEDLASFELVGREVTRGDREFPSSIEATSPFARGLGAGQGLVVRDGDSKAPDNLGTVDAFQRFGAECICPIVHESGILALLVLGQKSSGDPYFAHDIDLLLTVASQAAVAIKNAELYRRVGLLEAQRRRAERLAESGSLSVGIAHEIKNPLVAIRTFAELLPERYDDAEFRSEFAQVMIREIARLERLVDRLRGLGKSSDLELTLLDVRDPLEDTLTLLSAKFEQAGIRVVRSYSRAATTIMGNQDELKRLFLNLLINSCEAMTERGEITVRIADRNTLGLRAVVVDIEDEGLGIAEDIRDTLFYPFVSTKQGSSGLGLWLCRRIVDAHNAVIRAANRDGNKGARFTIEFPTPFSR